MRTRQFEVPTDLIGNFFTTAEEEGVEVELVEINEDGELVVDVNYDEDDRDAVMTLVELIDDYHDEE